MGAGAGQRQPRCSLVRTHTTHTYCHSHPPCSSGNQTPPGQHTPRGVACGAQHPAAPPCTPAWQRQSGRGAAAAGGGGALRATTRSTGRCPAARIGAHILSTRRRAPAANKQATHPPPRRHGRRWAPSRPAATSIQSLGTLITSVVIAEAPAAGFGRLTVPLVSVLAPALLAAVASYPRISPPVCCTPRFTIDQAFFPCCACQARLSRREPSTLHFTCTRCGEGFADWWQAQKPSWQCTQGTYQTAGGPATHTNAAALLTASGDAAKRSHGRCRCGGHSLATGLVSDPAPASQAPC